MNNIIKQMKKDGWNEQSAKEMKKYLEIAYTEGATVKHQDLISEVESVDIEQNRELYGTDFAAGMEKMKNIIIKSLTPSHQVGCEIRE